jgi:DNA repair exonuclease SbcCD ATPase subunit
MQLLRLHVKNWVHHRELTCDFTRGLVAILGENGSGKSSLFGAIRWALTGENPNFGVKADNVSQYAKEGEPAYVSLEFEHNGHIAEVTRHLLPEKEPSILTVDGKEAGRGDKATTAGVEKLLGVDAKFISRFIIVGQTDIFSFIDDNQTDTDKFFQRLFNTTQADKCQDLLGKNLAKLTVPEVLKTPGQLAREQAAISKQIQATQQELDDLPDFDHFLAAQKSDQAVIAQWGRREKLEGELQKLVQQKADYEKQLETLEQELNQYQTDIAALTGATDGSEQDYAAAREALGHWQSYKSVAKAKADLQAARTEIEQRRAANPEPPAPDSALISAAQATLTEAQSKLKDVKKFVEVFQADGIAHCPTCRTPTADLLPQLNQAVATDIPELSATIANAQQEIAEYQKAAKAYASWEKLNAELDARVAQLAASELSLVAVPPPRHTEEELTQRVGEYEQFLAVKSELEPLLTAAQHKKSKLVGAVGQVVERVAQIEAELADIVATAADADTATKRLEALQRSYAQRQGLEQQRTEFQFQYNQLGNELAAAEQQEVQAERLRKWSAVAERARAALKNAPRLVAQRNLLLLEASINELLQIFGVNFCVKVSTDGTPSFIAEFFDGRKQVAQRLSIGQKTVLALAFRVAVNSMFAEEIGLLALDEPTASLDAPRIKALAPVLEKLRELSTAKGLQCLLVTHASSLSHLFESTIELAPPEVRNVAHSRRDDH